MGRPKGGTNKFRTPEEKLRIINRYFQEGIGVRTLAKEEGVSNGLLWTWIHKFQDNGPDGLINQKNLRNRFLALQSSKSLTEEERLKLIIAKQDVEIERLKKGYYVKGDGQKKEFVISKDVSLK